MLSGDAPNLTYTPNQDYSGSDSFTFTVSDGNSTSAAATVTIEISNVNDAPTANAIDDQNATEDEAFSLDVTGNFSDPDGDTLSYSATLENGDALPAWLSFEVGVFSGTPEAGDVGSYSVTVTASDGSESVSDTFTLTVVDSDDAPVIEGDETRTLEINEDESGSLTLSTSDEEQGDLTWSIGGEPENGTASVTDGAVSYTPNENYNNEGGDPDSFTVTVSDGTSSDSVTVNVSVNAVNDAPEANDQEQGVQRDAPLVLTLTGSDVENSLLTFEVVDGPEKGSLSDIDQETGDPATAEVTYTPNEGATGTDSFTFTVSDGELTSEATTVTLTLNVNNTAPVAQAQTGDDAVTTSEDTEVTLTLNATEADENDTLTYGVVDSPGKGTLGDINQDGQVTYTPNENASGEDSFTFKANDGVADSNVATVEVIVIPANDAPVIQKQGDDAGESVEVTMSEDGDPTAFALELTAQDPDSESLTWSVSSNPTSGSASVTDGTVSYSPNENYSGEDSFTVETSDGELSDSLAVSVTVEAVNDAPTLESEITDQSVDEDASSNLDVAGNFSDVESDTLTYTATLTEESALPAWLSLSDGAFSGTPAETDVGSYDTTVTASDGSKDVSDTFTLTVNPVNDAPIGIALSPSSVEENQPAGTLVGTFTANDSDSTTFAYSLVAGEGDVDNASFRIVGDQFETTETFDYETRSGYSVLVEVSDGELSYQESFTVTVSDTSDMTYLTAGGEHTCALGIDEKAYCWGDGSHGQLGNGDTANQSIPVAVAVPRDIFFSQLTAGGDHTCAIGSDDKAYCWGDGSAGRLGNGGISDRSTPLAVTVEDVSFSQVASGGAHTCALDSGGDAYCWGNGSYGQLGNGVRTYQQNTPVAVTMPEGVHFSQIAAGGIHTCALGSDDKAYCWGGGRNDTQGIPVAVAIPEDVSQLTEGHNHSCALSDVGVAYCWGSDNFQQLGPNGNGPMINPVVVTMPADVNFSQITAGGAHTCALRGSMAYCWGAGYNGQLGNGATPYSQSDPVSVLSPQ